MNDQPLTPAEQAAEIWLSEADGVYIGEDLEAMARAVVAAARPDLYREAAARLREICDESGHGGDCCLTCQRGSDVDLLESWAAELEARNG